MKELRSSLVMLVLMTALTGIAYPFAVTGLAKLAFPWQAAGSLIERNGHIIGSALIGQQFVTPGYFWSRPSATTTPDPADASKSLAAPYNAENSGASNFAPSSKALAASLAEREQFLRAANPSVSSPIPADLLTSSASGLDPHISPAAARWQVRRVALARQIPEAELLQLVEEEQEGRELGILGEPRVNVLKLNLALDERWPLR